MRVKEAERPVVVLHQLDKGVAEPLVVHFDEL